MHVTALFFMVRYDCRNGKADVLCASCLNSGSLSDPLSLTALSVFPN